MSRSRWLLLVVVLFVAWQGWGRRAAQVDAGAEAGAPPSMPAAVDAVPVEHAPAPEAAPTSDGLPIEARDTLRLIASGGPFPYERDGITFGNHEKQLPPKPRGYYREYTVKTPGVGHRGARRIIAGGDPPVVFYYTDDHYRSFREIEDRP